MPTRPAGAPFSRTSRQSVFWPVKRASASSSVASASIRSVRSALASIDHAPTREAVLVERAFLAELARSGLVVMREEDLAEGDVSCTMWVCGAV